MCRHDATQEKAYRVKGLYSPASFRTPQLDSTVVTPTEQDLAIGAPVKAADRAAVSFERLCMGEPFHQTCVGLELVLQSCRLTALYRIQGFL